MGIFSRSVPKQMTESAPYLRRIMDLTTPGLVREDENRVHSRYNRGLPVAICPWDGSQPDTETLALGFTRDISDGGLSLLTTTELKSDEVVFAIIVDEAVSTGLWYFNATILRRFTAFGFLEYGMRINGFLNDHYRMELAALDAMLMQPKMAKS